MLRIEKLFIQGFKSFCDPTEVVFDEEGITAVVGPNGCGKSNVADAISWVIGEQRAKALRGGKMEDVIFQGSRNRQPSGLAEVMLTMVVRETFELRNDTLPPDESWRPEAAKSTESEAAGEALPSDSPDPKAEEAETDATAATPDAPETADSKKGSGKRSRRQAPAGPQRFFQEGERITVGRRLYRTGESEYEMNGRQCRLRDVQDLFAGTGLGGAHYAIIEQGRIGQVLSAKPLDRRALIEEAAGVSKFKLRQHAAELKLDASKQNLSRITDILSEIEKQQNSLRRQAARARRYQRLRNEMRDLMRAIFVVDYRGTSATITEREERLAETVEREAAVITERQRLEEELATATLVARAAEVALGEVRQAAAGIDVETERARQQKSSFAGQIQSFESRRSQMEVDRGSIAERRAFLDRELERLRAELRGVEEEINAQNQTLSANEEENRLRNAADRQAEGRLEETRKAAYESVTHLERWRQLQRQFTEGIDRCASRLAGLSVESERARSQAAAAIEKHEQLEMQSAETELRHERTSGLLADTSTAISVMRRDRGELQTRLNSLNREVTATEHRLKSLRELDQRRAFFSEAVQAILTRPAAAGAFRTLGTLADYLSVSPGDESMIETALRDELQYIVVPTTSDALAAITFLRNEGAGRATFLVIDPGASSAAGSAPAPSGLQRLEALLGLKPEVASAFRLAMPSLAGACVVDDQDEAFGASALTPGATVALTRTGERAVGGCLITGGSRSEKATGVLALKREIQDLTSRLDELEERAAEAESALSALQDRLRTTEEEQSRLDAELRQIDKQSAVLREQLLQSARDRERTATHIRVVEQDTARVEQERADYESRHAHATAELESATATRTEAEQALALAQSEVAELRRLAEERTQALSRSRAEFAARSERRRGLLNDTRRLESETTELHSRLSRLGVEAVEIDQSLASFKTSLDAAERDFTRLADDQQRMAAEVALRSQSLDAARERLDTLDVELRLVRQTADETRDSRSRQEVELARLATSLEHLVSTCRAELGEDIVAICQRLAEAPVADQPAAPALPLPSADSPADDEEIPADDAAPDSADISFWQVPENFNLEDARLRLADLAAKIEALGPINMMALDELTVIEERLSFLTTQRADLEKAIADTQSAIAEIRKRSRERFLEAFTHINEYFKQMFQELFGGGHGEMRLIDQNDLLESGIEIIAQPPGKRLQNVLLLSGGEKAMAALSLVMAIFKYRPSPFCLLDEVDAPLDEMNIGRFSDKVVQMSDQTQFMIITHSKRTMEAARTLYGVTMEDPGVSKLISVKLS